MAALTPSAQQITDPFRSGLFVVITKVVITGASDTVSLPEGLQSANHVKVFTEDSNLTAPAVTSITQNDHPQGATLTLTAGGTAGATCFVVSFHAGNQGGL